MHGLAPEYISDLISLQIKHQNNQNNIKHYKHIPHNNKERIMKHFEMLMKTNEF